MENTQLFTLKPRSINFCVAKIKFLESLGMNIIYGYGI